MTFQVGDRIAHPIHGAGVVDSIEQQVLKGQSREYYVLKLPVGDMLVKIPRDTCELIGVRPIIDAQAAEALFAKIPDIQITMEQNWNKRYRENMLRIKSGDLLEVAAVAKGLLLRDRERGLSTGERKMLHSAKQILISELVLAMSSTYEEVDARLTEALSVVCVA